MPPDLADRLDFALSWRHVIRDMKAGRTFFIPPFVRQLLEADLDVWLERIRDRIRRDTYQPGALRIFEVPKGKGAVRPGSVLAVSDQLVYSALVLSMWESIRDELSWGDPPPDYAYRLVADPRQDDWFAPHFENWRSFDRDSAALLDEGFAYVVVADIAGYYEQIDLTMLRSDLNALAVDREALKLLMHSLHRWSPTEKRGVPQGYSPSDLLGKLYLNSVDRSLSALGIRHMRWVDDYRLFFRSEHEAKKGLIELSKLLRSRALVLQSAKTEIVGADDARARFEGVHTILDPIAQGILRDAAEHHIRLDVSLPADAMEEFLSSEDAVESVEVLEEAYQRYIIDDPKFNKTVLRFLLNRLRSAGSEGAVEHSVGILKDRPEETVAVLKYVAGVGRMDYLEEQLVAFLQGPFAVYDYQIYEILRWRSMQEEEPDETLIAVAARLLIEGTRPRYVLGAARLIVGRWGSQADLERLVGGYTDAESELEKASIICATMRMENARRNAFLGHAQGDGELCAVAARLVRDGAIRFE